MRSALLLAVAAVVCSPSVAFAQDNAPEPNRDIEAVAKTLNDPDMQSAAAATVTSVVGAVLDIRVDRIAKALEPLNGGKPIKMKGNTLRALAERDDPDFERKIESGARTSVKSAGAMADALAAMLPELQRAVKKIGEALPARR
jgi:hypothetical protein